MPPELEEDPPREWEVALPELEEDPPREWEVALPELEEEDPPRECDVLPPLLPRDTARSRAMAILSGGGLAGSNVVIVLLAPKVGVDDGTAPPPDDPLENDCVESPPLRETARPSARASGTSRRLKARIIIERRAVIVASVAFRERHPAPVQLACPRPAVARRDQLVSSQ